jgi:hypothetical protein
VKRLLITVAALAMKLKKLLNEVDENPVECGHEA